MTLITVKASEKELRQTLNWLNAKPEQVERAERRAINKTLNRAGSFVARTVSHEHSIPLKVLLRGGGSSDGTRIRYKKAQGQSTNGSVWIGANPVKAAYVGKLSQRPDEQGASAGSYFYQGGFIAKMKSGHTGLFKRDGKSRLGITEQSVTLRNVKQATGAAQSFVPGWMKKLLKEEINFEVNVKGR